MLIASSFTPTSVISVGHRCITLHRVAASPRYYTIYFKSDLPSWNERLFLPPFLQVVNASSASSRSLTSLGTSGSLFKLSAGSTSPSCYTLVPPFIPDNRPISFLFLNSRSLSGGSRRPTLAIRTNLLSSAGVMLNPPYVRSIPIPFRVRYLSPLLWTSYRSFLSLIFHPVSLSLIRSLLRVPDSFNHQTGVRISGGSQYQLDIDPGTTDALRRRSRDFGRQTSGLKPRRSARRVNGRRNSSRVPFRGKQ